MVKLLKTSELASTLGVSKPTVINTVNKLGITPTIGKKSTFLFNEEQVRSIAESLGKSDLLEKDDDPKEQEKKDLKQDLDYAAKTPEHDQAGSYDDRLFDLIKSLQDQLKAKDDQIKAKDDQIRSKDNQLKAKDDQIRDLTKAVSDLTESNNALAANANLHTLSDKKETLLKDPDHNPEPLEIVPKENRSFLDKVNDLFR